MPKQFRLFGGRSPAWHSVPRDVTNTRPPRTPLRPPLRHHHHFSSLPFPRAQGSQAHKVAFEEDRQLSAGKFSQHPSPGNGNHSSVALPVLFLTSHWLVSLARAGFHGCLKPQRELGNGIFLGFQWEVSKEEGGWKHLLGRHPLESKKWGESGKVMFDLCFEGLAGVCLGENGRDTLGRATGGDVQQRGVPESSP